MLGGNDDTQSAVNGGAGKQWVNGVVTITGEQTAFRLGDTLLTLADLQASPTTATFTKKGNPVEITGATMDYLLTTYAPDAETLGVTFYDATGYQTPEVLFSE